MPFGRYNLYVNYENAVTSRPSRIVGQFSKMRTQIFRPIWRLPALGDSRPVPRRCVLQVRYGRWNMERMLRDVKSFRALSRPGWMGQDDALKAGFVTRLPLSHLSCPSSIFRNVTTYSPSETRGFFSS